MGWSIKISFCLIVVSFSPAGLLARAEESRELVGVLIPRLDRLILLFIEEYSYIDGIK